MAEQGQGATAMKTLERRMEDLERRLGMRGDGGVRLILVKLDQTLTDEEVDQAVEGYFEAYPEDLKRRGVLTLDIRRDESGKARAENSLEGLRKKEG